MRIVGRVTDQVAILLGISLPEDQNIYLGPSNLDHMASSHPADFLRYGSQISYILSCPDYIGQNPTDGSIEYVKDFWEHGNYVKVAVRLSRSERFYARSIYVLNPNRVRNYIAKGTLKPLDPTHKK